MTEYGDKLDTGEKSKIEAAIKDAEDALKSDDKDKITAQTEALSKASQKLGEKMYADSQAKAQAEGAAAGGAAGGSTGNATGGEAAEKKDEGNVVDAEYEEVKEKK